MGILNFHKWLRDKYPKQYRSIIKPIQVEHLYIDINFVLHNCIYGTKNIDFLYRKLYGFLDNVIKTIIPTKTITFATDGPAPYAKLLLQRNRRLQMTRKVTQNIDDNTMTALYFTPGSTFMKELESKISNYIDGIEKNLNIKAFRLLSGFDEAEIKIVNKLLEINKDSSEKHLILSNDADIIVMLMSLDCNSNLLIGIRYHGFYVFDISKLVSSIQEELVINKENKFNKDFSFGFLLMGNDYLPKVKYISVEKIYNAFSMTYNYYNKIKVIEDNNNNNIVDENLNINKEVFRDFINNLCNLTQSNFINNFKITEFNKSMYKNYIEGLLWCILMYSTGKCHRYDYLYSFNDSPHLAGILHYIDFYYDDDFKDIINTNNSKPIPEDLYSILVLPKKAQNMIPKIYHSLINKNLKFLYEEEECNTCIDFSKDISNLYEVIKSREIYEEDTTDLRKKAGALCKKLGCHKKKHKTITIKDIKYCMNLFEKNI
jgi:5'-3' exonuclease